MWANVRNRGGGTSQYTILRYYRSTDATITRSDTQVATEWVARLRIDSDEYDGHELEYAVAPSSIGTYYYGACVDAVSGESDTANNCSAAVKVQVSHNSPEIWPGSWSVAGSRPAGQSTRVGLAVHNRGSPSDATKLRLFLVPDRTSERADGTQVGVVDVPALVVTEPSWAASFNAILVFQAPATAGLFYYLACVDPVPRESDTTNNCSSAIKVKFR